MLTSDLKSAFSLGEYLFLLTYMYSMDVCSDKPEKESLSQNCKSVFMVILVAIIII